MKPKWIALLMAALMITAILTGCAGKNEVKPGNTAPLKIVATIFPLYDWTREILGENGAGVELTLLMESGADLHSYQPSAEDLLKIAECDLFVFVGGESDGWVKGALESTPSEKRVTLDLMEILAERTVEEESIEGMEAEEEEEEPETDEHVWLSLNNATAACSAIADALCELDPANAETYEQNRKQYNAELMELDGEYRGMTEAASGKVVLFADRFPFRYLTEDYGLSYYAAFRGCSAETEASFSTVTFLAGKVDELGLEAVLTLEGSDQRIAETVIENTVSKNQKILVMDSLQSSTSKDIRDGKTYLSAMRTNLEVLREALG